MQKQQQEIRAKLHCIARTIDRLDQVKNSIDFKSSILIVGTDKRTGAKINEVFIVESGNPVVIDFFKNLHASLVQQLNELQQQQTLIS